MAHFSVLSISATLAWRSGLIVIVLFIRALEVLQCPLGCCSQYLGCFFLSFGYIGRLDLLLGTRGFQLAGSFVFFAGLARLDDSRHSPPLLRNSFVLDTCTICPIHRISRHSQLSNEIRKSRTEACHSTFKLWSYHIFRQDWHLNFAPAEEIIQLVHTILHEIRYSHPEKWKIYPHLASTKPIQTPHLHAQLA